MRGKPQAQPDFLTVINLNQCVPENRGVEPDYTVEPTPADLAAGRDPQLEKAIELAQAALATYRKQVPPVPQQ